MAEDTAPCKVTLARVMSLRKAFAPSGCGISMSAIRVDPTQPRVGNFRTGVWSRVASSASGDAFPCKATPAVFTRVCFPRVIRHHAQPQMTNGSLEQLGIRSPTGPVVGNAVGTQGGSCE